MNNSWFKITTSLSRATDSQQLVVCVKHPVDIKPPKAGVTVPVQAKAVERSHGEDKSIPSVEKRKDMPIITPAELARHNTK